MFKDLNTTSYSEVCLLTRMCVSNNFIKDLQYQIIHRFLPTNYLLYRMGKVESNRCSLCQIQCETIPHLLYECVNVNVLWRFMEQELSAMEEKDTVFPLFSRPKIFAFLEVRHFRDP